jgi:hypothetical protein
LEVASLKDVTMNDPTPTTELPVAWRCTWTIDPDRAGTARLPPARRDFATKESAELFKARLKRDYPRAVASVSPVFLRRNAGAPQGGSPMSRRHGVGKRLRALAKRLGYADDVQITERGHLQFVHPSGRIVTAGTRSRGERNATAALKRHARLWQRQSPSSPPASPGA